MAVEYMNDSYNRCIAELRTRYRGRAVSSSVKDEAVVNDDKNAITESYILFDSRSKIADTYRSGEYNGSKYMHQLQVPDRLHRAAGLLEMIQQPENEVRTFPAHGQHR